jgi:hypothetical protein
MKTVSIDWKSWFSDVICLSNENERFMENCVKTYWACQVVIGGVWEAMQIVFVGLNYEWKLKHNGKWDHACEDNRTVVMANIIYLYAQPRAQKNKLRNLHPLVSCYCSFASV